MRDEDNEGHWEYDTRYEYQPWESVVKRTTTGSTTPRFADTSDMPYGDEWRRVKHTQFWWIVAGKKITVANQSDWQRFEAGEIVDVTHQFGRYISANLHESESLEPSDFDL